MIARILGRYRITAKLGEGGTGSVWRGEDPALKRTVALKVLSPSLWDSETACQRFVREGHSAARLEHHGIATVYDVGESDGVAWIAYQFIDGESVASRTGCGPLPVAEASGIALGTAEALVHAHARGVLHRDVTAGNVMVTRDGRAVLVDFGLALPGRGTRLTTTGGVFGTAGYMAPEVIRGEPADERSDLYGLGAVLYRMLTGRLPFDGGSAEAVFYRVLNESAPPPSDLRPEIPPALEHIVLRLLERMPADRYASATEVAEALRAVAPNASPSRIERVRRAVTRRWRWVGGTLRRVGRLRIGVAALASVVLLAAAAWFAGSQGWLPGDTHGPPVLAVLPFENTSADPEEVGYLAEGLGDELVLKLGRVHGYRVLPWTTTRRHRDPQHSVQRTANDLHADLILVGTFRADDERVRVMASLVDGKSGVQRWSQSFDYLVSDLMSLQSNIATGVAAEIQGGLNPAEKRTLARRPSASPEAYAMYLQGAEYLQAMELSSRALAGPFFDRAIELDPNLAEAFVGRGAALLDLHFRGTEGGIASLRRAEQSFRKALELEPGLIRARKGLVTVAFEMGQPEIGLRVAADMSDHSDSDVEALLVRSLACFLFGYSDVGESILSRVLELDPENREAAWFRVVNFEWGGRYTQSIAAGKEYIRRFGEDPEIYHWMGVASAKSGLTQDADLLMGRAVELMGETNSNLYGPLDYAHFLRNNGEAAQARRIADQWIPLLRDRARLHRDNYRVLGVLIGFEGMVGDTASIRQHVRELLVHSGLHADFSPGWISLALDAVLASGTLEDMRALSEAARGRDLGILNRMRSDDGLVGAQGGVQAAQKLEIYRRLQAAIRERVDELGRRYLPEIALRDGSS